jgi:hypothetical protein
MSQPESRLQRKIQDALKLEFGFNLFIFKIWGNERMLAGLPDLIGCLNGKFFGLEVKLPENRGKTSARQEYVAALIERAGGFWGVVCSAEEAMSVLTQLQDRE